ncbi:MAG: hypothetical protein MUE48_07540 [Desulfobacterales bacterium]|nr:hypothetical protein [Desulfobacterales bacterium]
MMVLVGGVALTAVAAMLVPLVMPVAPALVGMTLVMFMAVVVFVLVMMAHGLRSYIQ